jgi:hypothetical protein
MSDITSKIAAASRGTPPKELPKTAERKKKQTLYLPESVWMVFRDIAHTEQCSQHDLFKRALDMFLHDKGLPSWDEIEGGAKVEIIRRRK